MPREQFKTLIQEWMPRMGIRIVIGGMAVVLLIAMGLYGTSVYFENRVLTLAHETRTMQLDNQDLQISLDRIRSFKNVAEASSKIQGLHTAEQVIEVPEAPPNIASQPIELKTHAPKAFYGY